MTLITAIIVSISSIIVAYISYRTKTAIETISIKIEEVRHATNSLTDRLVKLTGESEFARGVEETRNKNKYA